MKELYSKVIIENVKKACEVFGGVKIPGMLVFRTMDIITKTPYPCKIYKKDGVVSVIYNCMDKSELKVDLWIPKSKPDYISCKVNVNGDEFIYEHIEDFIDHIVFHIHQFMYMKNPSLDSLYLGLKYAISPDSEVEDDIEIQESGIIEKLVSALEEAKYQLPTEWNKLKDFIILRYGEAKWSISSDLKVYTRDDWNGPEVSYECDTFEDALDVLDAFVSLHAVKR